MSEFEPPRLVALLSLPNASTWLPFPMLKAMLPLPRAVTVDPVPNRFTAMLAGPP